MLFESNSLRYKMADETVKKKKFAKDLFYYLATGHVYYIKRMICTLFMLSVLRCRSVFFLRLGLFLPSSQIVSLDLDLKKSISDIAS